MTDKALPCVQTFINMADEGHVISKLQVAKTTLHADNATLHTYGTSRDHNKLVGQQISLPSRCSLSLGFVQVESHNASTLLDITTGVLDELSAVYCWKDEDKEKDAVFSELLKSISSLMSDRVICWTMSSLAVDEKPSQWMARFWRAWDEWDHRDVERWALLRHLPSSLRPTLELPTPQLSMDELLQNADTYMSRCPPRLFQPSRKCEPN